MAGTQLGLGRMLSSIGQSMGQWDEQKKQAEQAALNRALQERQLKLQEQDNARQQAEFELAAKGQRFNQTLQTANVMPDGAALDSAFAKTMDEVGLGSLKLPGGPETLAIPNMRGEVSPVEIPMPARMIATQPPGFRQADRANELKAGQFDAALALKVQALQAKIEQADRNGDIAALRAGTAQLMALIQQNSMDQRGADMDVDNVGAWEARGLAHAKALVDGDVTLFGEARQKAFTAALAKWKEENPQPGSVRGGGPARGAGAGNAGRSTIF